MTLGRKSNFYEDFNFKGTFRHKKTSRKIERFLIGLNHKITI